MKEIFPSIGYKSGELYVEETKVREIAEEVGTPVYIYSKRAIEKAYREIEEAFSKVNLLIAFAVKSNSNVWVLKVLKELGAGADTVSVGEIFRAITAGIEPKKILFAGVGKREDEIEFALERGILMFNVESEGELLKIESVAERLNKVAPIAVRVNPEVNPKTHPYIATGLRSSKFGVDFETALKLYRKAKESRYLKPIGIHFHIGSQITDVSAFEEAASKVKELVKELQSRGVEVEYFDAGGGLGINYKPDEKPVPAKALAEALIPHVKEVNCKLILEPGRRIVGNAGILVTKLLYRKETPEKLFYVVDAGMNDLARPSLYKAYHHIEPVKEISGERIKATVVGPICESGDQFGQDRPLPLLKEGELLAVFSAGAYGFSMASNYNSRPRPAEVLVDGSNFKVIRQRETLADLISREF
ncbi:diaminopimelate decarboxylase [Thermovibrio guaymasensis]|uniref:Diaminopimelate decarboxylase n=1 Tax=Thermovibrio guaymasensis TaxID=240167 RepID=A0A420W8G3_9BACT|nr:diaminopimelate decarboxylase [Thermovibrio guaymasensis]RKQ63599.1 diaminopimelate decarboxylase [Thermovibrio guaymasensis]